MKLRGLLLGLIVILPTLCLAETTADQETCNDDDGTITDRMRACSQIIAEKGATSSLGFAYRNRGDAFSDTGQWDFAIADETKAIDLNPQDATAYNIRAWAYLKSGNVKQALADVNKALAIDPKLTDALHTRAETYEAMGMTKEAIDDYHQALAIDPRHEDSEEALDRLGVK